MVRVKRVQNNCMVTFHLALVARTAAMCSTGFPRPIAHGMWTKARCLAALRLPDAFTAEVRFKRPILLPGTVTFGEAADRFAVHGYLEGVLRA